MYDESRAECDKCNSRISDGDEMYCQDCVDFMKDEIEEQRKAIEILEAENATLDERAGELIEAVKELEKELTLGGRIVGSMQLRLWLWRSIVWLKKDEKCLKSFL